MELQMRFALHIYANLSEFIIKTSLFLGLAAGSKLYISWDLFDLACFLCHNSMSLLFIQLMNSNTSQSRCILIRTNIGKYTLLMTVIDKGFGSMSVVWLLVRQRISYFLYSHARNLAMSVPIQYCYGKAILEVKVSQF